MVPSLELHVYRPSLLLIAAFGNQMNATMEDLTPSAHSGPGPSYLPQLQRDLLKVIRKYVAIDQDAVNVRVEHEGNQEILELNIVLPEG